MLKKTKKLIVTFDTMSDALIFEKYCKSEKIIGRLIPIPREISAGCGMSWASEMEYKEKIINLVNKYKIEYGEYFEIMR